MDATVSVHCTSVRTLSVHCTGVKTVSGWDSESALHWCEDSECAFTEVKTVSVHCDIPSGNCGRALP